MFTAKDILICTFVLAAGIIIELRFEKKVINDEKWKQEISQYIKVIKSSNKQLSQDIKDIKSSNKQLSQDLEDTKSSTKQLSQDIKDIKSSTKQLTDFSSMKNNVDPCDMYLVSGYGKESVSLTASSSYDQNHGPHRGFLNTEIGSGSWCARTNDRNQYLQVELPFISRIVGVATQRRYNVQQWVTSYRVYYSEDCIKWELIGGGDGKVFAGNVEGDDIKKNFFNQPVKAKCIRVNPVTWYNHVSMRMDVIGCRI